MISDQPAIARGHQDRLDDPALSQRSGTAGANPRSLARDSGHFRAQASSFEGVPPFPISDKTLLTKKSTMEIRSSLIGVRTAAAIRPFTQEAEVIASRAPPKPDRKNASAIGFSWKGAVGRFIADRLLEEAGFELLVPRADSTSTRLKKAPSSSALARQGVRQTRAQNATIQVGGIG
jgi:hypothetical protein